MATRPNTTGSRALSGAGAGLAQVGDDLLAQNLAAKAEQRRAALAVQKELEDKVAAGTLEPEQASQMASNRGIKLNQQYFESLQPSHENKLKGIITGMGKAPSLETVPSATELSYQVPGGVSKSVGFGAAPDEEQPDLPSKPLGDAADGQPQELPSTKFGPTSSPDMQTLLGARQQKLDSFQAVPVQNTDAQGNKITQYTNPSKLTGTVARPEPTAQQAGVLEGLRNVLKTQTESDQGLPELTGKNKGRELLAGELSPEVNTAKAAQTTATSTASAQAELGVNSSPQALELVRRKASIEAGVKQAFAEQGLTPEFANSFVHQTAWGPYYEANLVQGHAQGPYITRAIAQAQKTTGVKIAPLDAQSAQALSVMQEARDNINFVADTFAKTAPKSAASRIITGPSNKLSVAMQSNPQLAAMVNSEMAATMQNAGAMMQGVRGLRMGKDVIDKFLKMGPQGDDTLAVVRQKQAAQIEFLTNAANRLLK